jgi:hypothetical protein
MFLSKFRLTILLAIVFCVWLLPSSAKAQEVHALLVIMDGDPALGSSVKVDREIIKEFLNGKVGRVYQTNIKVLNSSAGETTPSNIRREIRDLRPGRDDVVFFYFSGHGGMISETDKRTFLIVSDPASSRRGAKLMRADLEADVNAHNCRLKLIVTDCCSNYPLETGARNYVSLAGVRARAGTIRNLFGEHKGLLHVNGATEGQYGWSSGKGKAGIFTDTLIPSLTEDSDKNKDGFVEWSEVLDVARKMTGVRWEALGFKANIPAYSAQGLDQDQITVQAPRVYSNPSRTNGKTTEISAGLWNISNAYSDTGVSFETNKDRYRVDDLVTLEVRPKRDCYLTVLNWGPSGNLTQLFPNKFDPNNRLQGGKTYTIPPRRARYEIFLAKSGVEKLKILTVADESVSDRINKVFSYSDNPDNPYRGQTVVTNARAELREAAELVSKEGQIEKILKGLDADDWGEDRTEATVR